MIAIQYTLSISKINKDKFLQYSREVLAPIWKKYGCIRYECAQIEDQEIVGRQLTGQDRYIERLYFNDDFDIPEFYRLTRKEVPQVTQAYESQFGAYNIELRILKVLV